MRAHLGDGVKSHQERWQDLVTSPYSMLKPSTVKTACSRCALVTDWDRLQVVWTVGEGFRFVQCVKCSTFNDLYHTLFSLHIAKQLELQQHCKTKRLNPLQNVFALLLCAGLFSALLHTSLSPLCSAPPCSPLMSWRRSHSASSDVTPGTVVRNKSVRILFHRIVRQVFINKTVQM